MNFENKFLKEQIITYLGNKRKLLVFLDETIDELIQNDKDLVKKDKVSFLDAFSGSGIVSRYAKLKGLVPYTNDLESYSYIINQAMIGTNPEDVQEIFDIVERNIGLESSTKSYFNVLKYLNSLEKPVEESSLYFSKHYAPKDTSSPDFNNERLFYTQENGLKIDAIQEVIQNKDLFTEKAKNIILASLCHHLTTNINTSGTMKGFHNGWGGKGKNSLNRIMAPIILKEIPFIKGDRGVHFNNYAEKLFTKEELHEIDIIYADPPYNQHQYSANYNHLTTLVKNDKYEPGEVIKGSRAGIRTDHNRSNFCKSVKDKEKNRLVDNAFREFISEMKGKYIIMSYNNEGLVKIDDLVRILSEDLNNKISIKYKMHDKYKGGKNTNVSNKVLEYLIIIEKGRKQDESSFNKMIDNILKLTKKEEMEDMYIDYDKIVDNIYFKVTKGQNHVKISRLTDIDDRALVLIDLSSYKVLSSDEVNMTEKEKTNVLEYSCDKLCLIKKYIYDKNKKEAEKILNSFKIKKYDEEYTYFSNEIDKLE